MKNIYACLIGEWVNLSADDTVKMGEDMLSANQWYEENASIWSPLNREPDTYYELDYVHIRYQGKDYRINPIFIQVVE
ncbi:hypothetical protein ACGCUP_07225 [Eubacteriales bacterium KG125]